MFRPKHRSFGGLPNRNRTETSAEPSAESSAETGVSVVHQPTCYNTVIYLSVTVAFNLWAVEVLNATRNEHYGGTKADITKTTKCHDLMK